MRRVLGPSPLAAVVAASAIALLAAPLLAAAPQTFVVDTADSQATIIVGKAGLFSFAAGHTHEVLASGVSGTVELEAADLSRSTIQLEIDAKLLKVTGKGEPAKDVPEVQQIMLSDKVLDVDRHPKIVFQSTRITVVKRADRLADLSVTGNLTLHGATRPVTTQVSAEIGTAFITARGRFEIKQTDFGITPISVAGVVKVKNELDISFSVVARAR